MHRASSSILEVLRRGGTRKRTELHQRPRALSHCSDYTALRAAGSNRTTKRNKHAVSLRQGQTRFSGKRNPDRAQRHFEILQTVHCSFTVVVPQSKPLPPLSTLSVTKDTTTLTKPSGSPSPQREFPGCLKLKTKTDNSTCALWLAK